MEIERRTIQCCELIQNLGIVTGYPDLNLQVVEMIIAEEYTSSSAENNIILVDSHDGLWLVDGRCRLEVYFRLCDNNMGVCIPVCLIKGTQADAVKLVQYKLTYPHRFTDVLTRPSAHYAGFNVNVKLLHRHPVYIQHLHQDYINVNNIRAEWCAITPQTRTNRPICTYTLDEIDETKDHVVNLPVQSKAKSKLMKPSRTKKREDKLRLAQRLLLSEPVYDQTPGIPEPVIFQPPPQPNERLSIVQGYNLLRINSYLTAKQVNIDAQEGDFKKSLEYISIFEYFPQVLGMVKVGRTRPPQWCLDEFIVTFLECEGKVIHAWETWHQLNRILEAHIDCPKFNRYSPDSKAKFHAIKVYIGLCNRSDNYRSHYIEFMQQALQECDKVEGAKEYNLKMRALLKRR